LTGQTLIIDGGLTKSL